MPHADFVHLRVHSAYSLLEGALPLARIVGHATADSQPAIAVTDTNNLFGALEFAEKARKDGIQPIIGCHLDIGFGDAAETDRSSGARPANHAPAEAPLVFIAATEEGYANLVRLVSRAWLETPADQPVHARPEWLAEFATGMICLTGGSDGAIGRQLANGETDAASARLQSLKGIFALSH